MRNERVLAWVQRNREPRDRFQAIGASAARVMGEVVRPMDDLRMTAVNLALGRLVDDEFRAHSRLSWADARTLRVSVDSPPMVAVLRRRWESTMLRELSKTQGCAIVSRVWFEYGTAGSRMTGVAARPRS